MYQKDCLDYGVPPSITQLVSVVGLPALVPLIAVRPAKVVTVVPKAWSVLPKVIPLLARLVIGILLGKYDTPIVPALILLAFKLVIFVPPPEKEVAVMAPAEKPPLASRRTTVPTPVAELALLVTVNVLPPL